MGGLAGAMVATERARRELGWSPASALDDGLRALVAARRTELARRA